MLKLTEREEIWWPVAIRKPREDGSGRTDRYDVKIKFRLMTRTDAKEMIGDEADGSSQAERLDMLLDRVSEHVLDWEGIDLECNPENVRLAMDKPYVSDAVITGLREASAGGRAKN